MALSIDARPSRPSPAELFRLDRSGSTGLTSIASEAIRQGNQRSLRLLGEKDLFAPAKPRTAAETTIVRDNILLAEARPAISGVVDIFTETPPIIPVASDVSSAKRESARQRKQATMRVGAAGGVLLSLTVAAGALAQDASPQPSPIVPPSGEPSALPTDPLTGLVICPSPSPEVSPSPSPTPVIIAVVGEALPQEAASPAPSIGELFPSLSPAPTDPLTGAIICPSPTPEVTPSPSPTPTEVQPTPEPTPGPDSIQVILNGKLSKITETEYSKILKKATKNTARWFSENKIIPHDTPAEDYAAYMQTFNDLIKKPDAKLVGKEWAGTITGQVQKAQEAIDSGDEKAARAFMSIAFADARAAITFIRHPDSHGKLQENITRDELILWLEDWAKERNLR